MRDPPDPGALRLLHQRLLAGDRVASEELFRLLLIPLQQETARRCRNVDEQLVNDGVIDALLDYSARPQQFDAAGKTPLDRCLATAAWRNVSNLLAGERRRKQRERKVGRKKREESVGLDPLARNIRREELRELEERKAAMFAALKSPTDRAILDLILQDVHDTAPVARLLGITDRPLEEQQQEANRHKDRIKRFLRRKGLLP